MAGRPVLGQHTLDPLVQLVQTLEKVVVSGFQFQKRLQMFGECVHKGRSWMAREPAGKLALIGSVLGRTKVQRSRAVFPMQLQAA